MFKFSLESVLKVRAIEEQAQQARFYEYVALRREMLSVIDGTEENIKQILEALSGQEEKGIFGIHDFKLLKTQLDLNKAKLVKEKENLAKFDIVFEKEKEKMGQAMKNRKVMENLRDKEYSRYLEEQKKAELNFIDEINTIRFKFQNSILIDEN